MDILLITHAPDLDKAVRCVSSIEYHGIGDNPPIFHIVINDCKTLMSDARAKWPKHKVWHWSDISPIRSFPSGWWSQQWLKLTASSVITHDWYLVVDSDMWLDRHIDQDELFCGDRARAQLRDRKYYSNQPRFLSYMDNARDYFGLSDLDSVMRDVPPNILRTSITRDLVENLDPGIFGSMSRTSLEFFLYWAWLCHHDLQGSYYVPEENWLVLGNAFFTKTPDQVDFAV